VKAVECATRMGCRTNIGLEILQEERRRQSGIGSELADSMIELIIGRRGDAMMAFDIHDARQDTEKVRQILNCWGKIGRRKTLRRQDKLSSPGNAENLRRAKACACSAALRLKVTFIEEHHSNIALLDSHPVLIYISARFSCCSRVTVHLHGCPRKSEAPKTIETQGGRNGISTFILVTFVEVNSQFTARISSSTIPRIKNFIRQSHVLPLFLLQT